MNLITRNKFGLYCPRADVYIDPWRKVDKAIITHAHSDHCRPGHKNYLTHRMSAPAIRYRLGKKVTIETKEYGEVFTINGVKFSLHSAAHLIGSSQVRIEYKGEVWVISGDYKTENDGISGAFELVKCNHFISECTFGLPIYHWKPQSEIFNDMNQWWENNQKEGRASLIAAYSLGKAQRVMYGLDKSIGKIFAQKSAYDTTIVLKEAGADLPAIELLHDQISADQLKGSMILSAPNAFLTDKLGEYSSAMASGWMNVRRNKNRYSTDTGFVLSDHADWKGLNDTIVNTGAENVYLTHGYSNTLSRYLREKGINAHVLETAFGEEE